MKTTLLVRIASVLAFIHAALHELGQHGAPDPRPQAAAVLAMRTNSFPIMGVTRTLWDFYRGLSTVATISMVLVAVILWMLGGLARRDAAAARPMIAACAFAFLAFSLVSYKLLIPPPVVMELLIAALLGFAAIGARKSQAS